MINEIVVDFDDTLSFTLNRDFENATPNMALITKLNSLFDKGWKVHIVTARGQISCEGDCDRADKKYRAQIEKWLKKHKAKFSSLSFQKKLARYYIDDKAMTPDDFLKLEFEHNGKSGAHIVMDSMYVYKEFKTYEEAQALIEWSNLARSYLSYFNFSNQGYIKIPSIHTLIGKEVKMDRFRGMPHTTESIHQAINLASLFSNFAPAFDQSPMLYFQNIFAHLKCIGSEPYEVEFLELVNKKLFGESSMLEMFEILNASKTFSHGDFSVQNILKLPNYNLALIDPIFDKSKFQSYLLDLAKLKWSLIVERNSTWIHTFDEKTSELSNTFQNLVICEGIRTLKYCLPSDRLNRMGIIEELCVQD